MPLPLNAAVHRRLCSY